MANMPTPKQNMTKLAPVTDRTLNSRKGISGWDATLASMATKAMSSSAAMASSTKVEVAVQATASVREMA